MGKLIPAKERVWVSARSKGMYESLVGKGKGKDKRFFKSQAALFDLCAAIGLREGQSQPVEERVELVQSYSVDKEDALALVLIGKEPDLEGERILRRLEEYAEYGIQKVHSWVTRIGARSVGDLNIVTWLKLGEELGKKSAQPGRVSTSS